MTREEILGLGAGRETDLLVLTATGWTGLGEFRGTEPGGEQTYLPRPSRYLPAALEEVERFCDFWVAVKSEKGYVFNLGWPYTGAVRAPTLELAACRALLLWQLAGGRGP